MTGFLMRWLVAFFLLAATWNPTGWDYIDWARENWSSRMSLAVLFGLVLLVGYIVYLRATLHSIGYAGMALVGAIVAALIWVLSDLGWLSLQDPDLRAWVTLGGTSFVLGIGVSWSRFRRWLTGQLDVDEVEE